MECGEEEEVEVEFGVCEGRERECGGGGERGYDRARCAPPGETSGDDGEGSIDTCLFLLLCRWSV